MSTLPYDLALRLKKAGFEQKNQNWCDIGCSHDDPACLINMEENAKPPYSPTLPELIDACGDKFGKLVKEKDDWYAYDGDRNCVQFGRAKEIAAANLWLALQTNK